MVNQWNNWAQTCRMLYAQFQEIAPGLQLHRGWDPGARREVN